MKSEWGATFLYEFFRVEKDPFSSLTVQLCVSITIWNSFTTKVPSGRAMGSQQHQVKELWGVNSAYSSGMLILLGVLMMANKSPCCWLSLSLTYSVQTDGEYQFLVVSVNPAELVNDQ